MPVLRQHQKLQGSQRSRFFYIIYGADGVAAGGTGKGEPLLISLYKTIFMLQQYRNMTFSDIYELYPFELEVLYGLILMDNEERKRKAMQEKAKSGY